MAVDYLFDPQTLAAATAADDTTRVDQLSVDDGSCKYRLRPLCLADYGRGTQRVFSGRTRSSFKHNYFFFYRRILRPVVSTDCDGKRHSTDVFESVEYLIITFICSVFFYCF